ncbi:MAG: signal transduction histidine kinase [Granulosicoccus sp.]|jgi:signal transduction histidine kinase
MRNINLTNNISCLWILIIGWGLTSSGFAAPVVSVHPGEDFTSNLSTFISYKKLASNEKITDDSFDSGLKRIEGNYVGFGRADGVLLFVLDVENKGSEKGEWILSTGRVAVLRIEFYELIEGKIVRDVDNLNPNTIGTHLENYHSHSYPFSLKANEKKRFAIAFQGSNISLLFPTIRTKVNHQKMIDENFLATAVSSTATLVLIIVNVCLFLLTRNSAFCYFALAEFAFVYQSLHLANYTSIYLFNTDFELAGFFSSLALLTFSIASIRFAQVFLRIKTSWPKLNVFLNSFLLFSFVVLVCAVAERFLDWVSARDVLMLSVLVCVIAGLILPFVGVWAARRFGWYCVPLMISWLIFGGFILFYALASMSVIEGAHSIRYWFSGIGFVEAFFITISVALDIRLIQNREMANERRFQQELAEKLDFMIKTNDLTLSKNIALQNLADKGRLMLAAGHDARNFLGGLRHVGEAIQQTRDIDKANLLGKDVLDSTELLGSTLSTVIYSASNGFTAEHVLTIEMINVESIMDSLMMTHGQSAREHGQLLTYKSNVSYVLGDNTLLMRVLGNFISNSIKYGQHGKILVTARFTTTAVVLSVFDQSGGIQKKDLRHLMRASGERLRLDNNVAGVGSGLRICRNLALQIGASLNARSILGKGSVFEIRLPHEQILCSPAICAFSSFLMISDSCREALEEKINVVKLDQLTARPNIDAVFFRPKDYFDITTEIKSDVSVMKILVTNDNSIEFREEWIDRVNMFVSFPLNESIVMMAVSRLLKNNEEVKKSIV